MLDVRCNHCGRMVKIPEEYLGQWGKCTHCKGKICAIVEPIESSPAVIQAEEENQESTNTSLNALEAERLRNVDEREPTTFSEARQSVYEAWQATKQTIREEWEAERLKNEQWEAEWSKNEGEKKPTTFYEAWQAKKRKWREKDIQMFGIEKVAARKKRRAEIDQAFITFEVLGCAFIFGILALGIIIACIRALLGI